MDTRIRIFFSCPAAPSSTKQKRLPRSNKHINLHQGVTLGVLMSAGVVRLRYSTIVNYISMIYRLIASVGFTVVIARKLSPHDFGVWGITLSTALMLINLWGIMGFWMSRDIARGDPEALPAGTSAAVVYAAAAAAAHVGLGWAQSAVFGWPFEAFLASAPMTAAAVFDRYLSSAVSMVKPEGVGYKNIVLDTVRLAAALGVMYVIGRVVYTPITAYTLGFASSSAVSLTILLRLGMRPRLGGLGRVAEWLRAAYIPLANIVRLSALSGARAIVSWATGSELSVAYLNVGLSSQTAIVRASAQSTPALYARLLMGRGGEDVEEVLRLFMLVTGFMAVSFIVLSKTVASLYNPLYTVAWPVVVIVTLFGVAEGLSNILTVSAWGSVRSETLAWEELRHTPLFHATYVRVAALVTSLLAGSLAAWVAVPDYLKAAEYFATSLLAGSAAYVLWASAYVRRSLVFRIPWREVTACVISSALAGAYYVLTGVGGLVVENFWSATPVLLAHGVAALGVYAVAWYAVSPWFRWLVRASLSYLGRFFT